MIKNVTKDIINQFGQSITVNNIKSKALIQPLRSDYQSYLYMDYQTSENKEQFLYIGFSDVNLTESSSDTLIKTATESYRVIKSEKVYLSDTAVYERAVLEKSSG